MTGIAAVSFEGFLGVFVFALIVLTWRFVEYRRGASYDDVGRVETYGGELPEGIRREDPPAPLWLKLSVGFAGALFVVAMFPLFRTLHLYLLLIVPLVAWVYSIKR